MATNDDLFVEDELTAAFLDDDELAVDDKPAANTGDDWSEDEAELPGHSISRENKSPQISMDSVILPSKRKPLF